ncbi:MAG: NAD(P)H-dependent oxidoreductase [Dehalococcoidia bacterium]|nr:NAD(P)H-dependent oxidoreductase [Dehalococcoidia bacterium]
MKIAVLNGSPKGEISVTVQYIKFIQKKFPDHEFKLINIAHDIIKIEKDQSRFQDIINEIKKADGVIWAFPLYVFLVASQYKRFIELVWERGAEGAFKDKYTCALSTSIHFFDHTAHNYLHAVCDDLGMRYTGFLSADMDDIFTDQARATLLKWAGDFLSAIEKKQPVARAYAPLTHTEFDYNPGQGNGKVDSTGLKIRLLADIEDEKSNIARMVKRFASAFTGSVVVTNIRDVNIKGGCLGCMQCAFDNICVYNDDFVNFVNSTMRDQDITVYAGPIRDRFLSARTKMYWDRCFFNGHVPLQVDKQIAFLVSGPLSQIANLREIMQAMAEVGQHNLAGVVTDECNDSGQLDALIDDLAGKLVDYSRHKYLKPATFLGVGGHKIFRDAIWARMRFPFDADYRYYESHGYFDFPQQDERYLEFSSQMIKMIQDPKMKEMVRKMMKTEMIKGYQKIVETK